MAQRRDWNLTGVVLLPVSAVLGYALTTVIGFVWPEHRTVAIVAAITVSVVLWLFSALWFQHRTGWWRWVCIVLFAGALLFPMVGSASLGPDLALEKHGDEVSGEVSDIDVEQTNHEEGEEAYRTTYTFVATDDGRDLGTVDYRGGKDAYGLDVGDRADLLVDPSGDLAPQLAEEVDSTEDVGLLVMGGVLYFFGYGLGLAWPAVRRSFA